MRPKYIVIEQPFGDTMKLIRSGLLSYARKSGVYVIARYGVNKTTLYKLAKLYVW